MRTRSILCVIILAAALSGCASPTTTPVPAAQPPAAPTPVEQATFTSPPPLPAEVVQTTAEPTATPFAPFTVAAMVDHLNVRSNPGALFDVIMNVAKGTKFTLQGKAPGGEWFLVTAANGSQGWVFGKLLESEVNLQAVPVIMPSNVQVLEGRITNESGQAVSGIQFAFVQTANGKEMRNDGNSDENGVILVFMPVGISGEWTVSYTAISCTSNTMDENCNCRDGICGNVTPAVQTIALPQKEPVIFTWTYAQ